MGHRTTFSVLLDRQKQEVIMRTFGLSVAEQEAVWERWRRGESLRFIARQLGKHAPAVRGFVHSTGGVHPRTRTRAKRSLSLAEREDISRGVAAGASCRSIARRLARAPSTVSREVRCNGGRGFYRAQAADAAADQNRLRPKSAKLALEGMLRAVVEEKLTLRWSPQQIAGWLPLAYPHQPSMRVSHETIYLSLFVQTRGALRRDLQHYLRTERAMRYPRGARLPQGRGQLKDMVNISARPAAVEDRAVPGHWEGDLVLGRRPSAVATLVERTSRYVVLVALPFGYKADQVRPALAAAVGRLPAHLRQSLTWDQGKEMAEHVDFTVDSGVQVYFCDPHSPWQRGSNENTNGLLRQYLAKSADLRTFDQGRLDAIAAELNGRPRHTLGFRTPAHVLAQLLG
jgi:IS30 family transposase